MKRFSTAQRVITVQTFYENVECATHKSGLKREPSKRRLSWRLARWGYTEKKEASHLLGLRGRHQYLDQRSNRNRAPCVASTAVGTKGEENQRSLASFTNRTFNLSGQPGFRRAIDAAERNGIFGLSQCQ